MTDKDRKILWAKSGNKCAFCFHDLVMDVEGDDTVVGDECHIISKSKKGPRYTEKSIDYYDSYDNMILMCKTHHKMIDDNENKFTEARLIEIKKSHENKIKDLHELASSNMDSGVLLLRKVTHTRDLVRGIAGAFQYATDYPVEKENDYELFDIFFDMIQNMDVIEDTSEFYKISMYDDIVSKIHSKGYVILVGFMENYGKYKLDTAFVLIKTKEEYKKIDELNT